MTTVIYCRDDIKLGDIQNKIRVFYAYKSREIINLEVELPYIYGRISIDKDKILLFIGLQTKKDIETIYSDLVTLAEAENGDHCIINNHFQTRITNNTKYYRDGSLTNPPDGKCPMKVIVRFTEINWRSGKQWCHGHGCFITSEVTKVILPNTIERYWRDELPPQQLCIL